MGSSGNQSPWAAYDTYKDCSQGICSIYCPQWCYIIFPPPPPPSSFAEDDSSADFSPLIIAVIGILASAFILVSYFTLISKYCRRRGHDSSVVEFSENRDQGNSEAWPAGTSDGLDETLIKSITVCRYKKNDGFVESTDCSVCLSEFQENENLRLLPKCSHAFHIPCIDTWLKSHSNCPLCRANITPAHIFPTNQTQAQETAGNVQMAAFEYQNRNDAVVVIDDLEVGVCEDCVVNLADVPKTESEGSREDAVQTMRRSVSLNSAQVSIADILRVTRDGDDDDGDGLQAAERLEKNRDSVLNLVAMKRSISTGRFMLTRSEKGWSSTTILS